MSLAVGVGGWLKFFGCRDSVVFGCSHAGCYFVNCMCLVACSSLLWLQISSSPNKKDWFLCSYGTLDLFSFAHEMAACCPFVLVLQFLFEVLAFTFFLF